MDLVAGLFGLVLASMFSACCGTQCLRCRHIDHTSRDQQVRDLLRDYASPQCPKDDLEPSSSGVVAVKCADPPSGMAVKCGYTSGRASAQHTYEDKDNNNGNQQKTTVNFVMNVRIFDCMYVASNTETGCKGDDDVTITESELVHLRKSASFLDNTEVLSYTGDLCFCDGDRCTTFDNASRGALSLVLLITCLLITVRFL